MRNLKGIDDVVKVVLKGEGTENSIGNGEIVNITEVSKWPDSSIHYTGTFHYKCPEGGAGYDSAIQFAEDEYEDTGLSTVS